MKIYCRLLCILLLASMLLLFPIISNVSAQSDIIGASYTSGSLGSEATAGTGSLIRIGYMGGERSVTAGYTGLVEPGTCVSSYFVYDLKGILASVQLPDLIWNNFSARLKGDYLFSINVPADQEITWLDMPTGIRSWNWAKSNFFKLQADISYRLDGAFNFIGGFRWESLFSTFGDPDPTYPFTISKMESGLGLGVYQPFVGVSLNQRVGPSVLEVRMVGFPAMFATLEHFNTCNNEGKPFAHVGRQDIRTGYFLDAFFELRARPISWLGIGLFLDWELYRGSCIMNLERRAMGPPETATAADVDFVFNRSSLTLGANTNIAFGLPF